MEIQIMIAVLGVLGGLAGGWFVGRSYQRRRDGGQSQAEIIAAEKAKVVVAVMPYLQLLKREMDELKAKMPK
jgi:hypothetical protein